MFHEITQNCSEMENSKNTQLTELQISNLQSLHEELEAKETECDRVARIYNELELILVEKQKSKMKFDIDTTAPADSRKHLSSLKPVAKKSSKSCLTAKSSATSMSQKESRSSIKSNKSNSSEEQCFVRNRILHIHTLMSRISGRGAEISREEKQFLNLLDKTNAS